MNKQDAIKQLSVIEAEAAKLRKIIEQPEELIGRITTYEQVCKELGEPTLDENDFSDFEPYMVPRLLAFAKIQQIAKLFNEGWKADWTNHNEYKYYPWFEIKASGGVCFYYSYVQYCYSCAEVAFYKTEKISDYVGKTFLDIYKELI